MTGKLPAAADSAKRSKTLLNVCWQPNDAVLLEALRPFKARSRGRRLKELALLGAELERLGFRLQAGGDGYRVLLPADVDGPYAVRAIASPDRGHAAIGTINPVRVEQTAEAAAPTGVPSDGAALAHAVPPTSAALAPAAVVIDPDTSAFAEAFIM